MSNFAVSKVSFSGYKAFKAPQELAIKPITIIFGYNNSGKSAVIRVLPMLAASFAENKRDTFIKSHLDYTAPCLRGASFKNLANVGSNKMTFSVEWADKESISFELKQQGTDESITFINFNEDIEGSIRSFNYIESVDSTEGSEQYELDTGDANKVILEKFAVYSAENPKNLIHKSIASKLQHLSKSIFWLNAIRAQPPREFTIDSSVQMGIKYDGSGTAETIWHLARIKSPAFDAINNWLEETCGRTIELGVLSQSTSNERIISKLETISVSDTPNSSPIRIPILDSGEGISQALPVVTLCAQAAYGELGVSPIVMLEQPELHLHPKAIITLANFLVKCIQANNGARFVIETHSESLLLAMQTALAGKQITLEDLCTYWVSKGDADEGSKLSKVEFDEDAYILRNFPEEVFQEVYEQAKSLMDVRERKGE